MKAPKWLYKWVDDRGRIPFWVLWLWPTAHFCREVDYLLIIDDARVCRFCSHRKP